MRILPGAVIASIVLLGLVGCSPTPPPIALPPSPTSSPLFATEEEALAAAEEVYGAYLRTIDAIGQGGWLDTSNLEAVATGELLEEDLRGASSSASQGLVQVGSASFSVKGVQDYSFSSPMRISIYACVYISGVDIRDEQGASVVAEDRPDVVPLQIVIIEVDEGTLKVAESERWSGADFC